MEPFPDPNKYNNKQMCLEENCDLFLWCWSVSKLYEGPEVPLQGHGACAIGPWGQLDPGGAWAHGAHGRMGPIILVTTCRHLRGCLRGRAGSHGLGREGVPRQGAEGVHHT